MGHVDTCTLLGNINKKVRFCLFGEYIVYTSVDARDRARDRARDGTVVRVLASHQCGPGSNPSVDAICGLSLLLVLSFALRGFSLGTPVFPSPQKPTFLNSNSTRNHVDKEPLCGCATSKSLFIYLFILFI